MDKSLSAIYEINNICKDYGNKRVLSSLSLKIYEGESVALIGPSGAGKTTLLNILANVIVPDSGEVLLTGTPLKEFKSRKEFAKKVGIMRQQFDLVRQLPAIQNVLAGRLNEWGVLKSLISLVFPEKDYAEKALERVGLADKIYEKTSNLSGGEQQRVAIARLLVQHPEVVLADEPISSLDPARADDILSILTKLTEEGGETLITVLHSVDYAKIYFKRIIGMRKGEIHFDLPAKEVTDELLKDLYTLDEFEEVKTNE